MTLMSLLMQQGCYTYVPLQVAAPAVGETVQFQISDRGRVELGERMGHGILRIEGRVTGTNADQYLINVASIAYVSGEYSRWSGESVRLYRDFVEHAQLRTLSKSRSWTAAIAATVVIGGFIASRGLLGWGTGDRDDPTPEPPASFRLRFQSQF